MNISEYRELKQRLDKRNAAEIRGVWIEVVYGVLAIVLIAAFITVTIISLVG